MNATAKLSERVCCVGPIRKIVPTIRLAQNHGRPINQRQRRSLCLEWQCGLHMKEKPSNCCVRMAGQVGRERTDDWLRHFDVVRLLPLEILTSPLH